MVKIRKLQERTDQIVACLTCVLCSQLLVDAVKIIDCFDTFCRNCISQKFREENLDCCPICKVHLGGNPHNRLRSDHMLQEIRNNTFPIGKEKKARDLLPLALLPARSKKAKVDWGDGLGRPASKALKKVLKEEEEENEFLSRLPPGYIRHEAVFGSGTIQPVALFYDNVNKPSNKKIWFTLIASENQEGEPLPQIDSHYVAMKDGRVPILYICIFLMEKLDLDSRDEIEIKCLGKVVSHRTRADVVNAMWLEEKASVGGSTPPNDGPPEDECLKVLHYGRKKVEVESP